MKKIILYTFLLFLGINTLYAQRKQDFEAEVLPKMVFKISEIMLHDVTNPPAASRFYAYAMLGAYEVIQQNSHETIQLNKLISHYPKSKIQVNTKEIYYPFASLFAMSEVARMMLPSGELLADVQDSLDQVYIEKGFSEIQLINSKEYARQIAQMIVDYAQTDNYSKISTLPKYLPKKGDGYWYPTPPAYMEAIEPHWNTIRPFFMESADQFKPAPPAEFSLDKESSFYQQMMEVYEKTSHLNEEDKEIAGFWDCNPFALATSGHLMVGLKKISPGGHWMGITGIVCLQKKVNFEESVVIHTLTALGLFDAFISCWDEKYRSDRIRPETCINQHIDSKWRPLLQTPPFPEYTSGHSVASSTASEILTFFLGNHLSFTDTSEEYFGLPARKFQSFRQAANEAAISRLYGGIHYRDAIEEGQKQGRNLAGFIIEKLKSKGAKPFSN